MKTGIITFHSCVNYGAFLQAYALQKYLEQSGCENKIINYRSLKFSINEYRSMISMKRPTYTLMNFRKVRRFGRALKELRMTKRCCSRRALDRLAYDAVVFGSDSIWNFSNPLAGFDPVYFGAHIHAKKLIAYAASFGPDTVGGKYPDSLPELLGRFGAFGVRDANTKNFVKQLTGRDSQIVLDPTFLWPYKREMVDPRESGYIFVYAIHLSEDQGRNLQSFARSAGKKTVSVGFYSPYCDINRVCVSPFEWLGYLKNADMVLTGMYHGTLFSIHFNRPFCAILSPYRTNKIQDILERFGLQNRIIPDSRPDVDTVLRAPLDFSAVNLRLQEERALSKEFLMRSMGNE